MYFSTKALRII